MKRWRIKERNRLHNKKIQKEKLTKQMNEIVSFHLIVVILLPI